jgi:hypothetical protein
MKESYDFYAVANSIADNLAAHGLDGWKLRIDDAIAAGSTGTEILMALRWVFRQLQESSDVPAQIDLQIKEFNQHLAALGI